MTLYAQDPRGFRSVPTETARVARAAFPQGNVYMRMRDEVGVLYADETFAPSRPCSPPAGAPLKPPGGWPSCRSCSMRRGCRTGKPQTPSEGASTGNRP